MKNKILIIAAHPDDEVLGCGGTIAKYAKAGDKVYCLILNKGKEARSGKKKFSIRKEQSILQEEAERSAKILGIAEMFFENFPDQKYDAVPLLNIIKAIEKIKEEIKPNIIFTHYAEDLNLDHRITFQAVLTACRPLKQETVKRIYSFEIPSSSEWGIPKRKNYFVPNVFEDILDTFPVKVKALESYKSELREYPHPRSAKGIEIVARRWGLVAGKKFVEAFELVREIKN
ncbi:MAG: PIG-L deacetylase family protein [Candidatus Parcubacteria bacterium]|nr:PIG-L deacetylase family protein [Candidatus Parcubacteria bacterium]